MDHVDPFLREYYEVHEWRHAAAILTADFPAEWADIVAVLREFRLYRSEILKPGGRKSGVATRIDGALTTLGWEEQCFETKIVVDDTTIESPTHKVDCFKNGIGLEIEWNNKDPFYDRDLNNFRLLFELRTVHVGVVVTRSDELQAIFDELGRGDSYGASTTHMSKLLPRLEGGSGGGCPIMVLGITKKLYVED
ncbi:MAG TPA: BglII/BstYI family type II restriction endonuclease [Vicinamibacterales bacterium]